MNAKLPLHAATDADKLSPASLDEAGRGGEISLPDTIVRGYLAVSLGAATVGVLMQALMPSPLPLQVRMALLLGFATLGVGSAWALALRGTALHWALVGSSLMGMGITSAVAWASGWGLRTGGLAFFPVIVLLACSLTTRRRGLFVAACALLALAGLGAADLLGVLRTPLPATGGQPLPQVMVVLLAANALAAFGGLILSRLLTRHVALAAEREGRFRSLLSIAAHAYWETDPSLRLTYLSRRDGTGPFYTVSDAIGQPLWALPVMQLESEAADRLRSQMAARIPFDDLPFLCLWAPGDVRNGLLSGEPRIDAQGRFVGYWGVSRDTTATQRAEQASLQAAEMLARVVAMSPDIITLTEIDTGRYVMVNDSFCRQLSHPRESVVGRTSSELGVWRHPVQRDQLLQSLSEHPQVQDRLLDFVTHDGHTLPLLISATRFDVGQQGYLLLNGRDISEATRVRQELSAILANASVGIAFSRHQRFVLVNALFEQMHGWPAGALIGKPLPSIWNDQPEVQAMQSALDQAMAAVAPMDLHCQSLRRDGSHFDARIRAQALDRSAWADSGTIWIVEDVTEALRAQQELARARDTAHAANQAKSAFLANTSHELRTPLNGVLGLARLARQPGLAPERLQRYLQLIGDSAEQLNGIISDILDMAKVEAGKLLTTAAPFDLAALLNSLAQTHAALAAEHGMAFEAEIDPGLPVWVVGDGLRVRQVLTNFLHNAFKFCDQGGVRLVAKALAGDWIRIEVHDTGPGIAPEVQARLFEPFTQGDASTTRRFGGTGLGLSICRDLAGLLGGQVGLDSQPGTGSCFFVTLPLPTAPVPVMTAAALAPPAQTDRLRGARVLLVEDNGVNLLIGTALLEEWGVQVTTAGDGAQALLAVAQAHAAGQMFQAVLMDLQMPGMGGLEATRHLRECYSAAQLPVIALTAAALLSDRAQVEAIGMNDFLTKPFHAAQLRGALLRAMNGSPSPS